MELAEHHGMITIELDQMEAADLADFLRQFYAGDGSVPDRLSEQLDAIIETF